MPLVFLLLFPGMVFAFGYVDAHGNGSPVSGFNAVSLGLGGARAIGFGDALSVLTNPAEIYRIPGTSFTMSIGPAVQMETVENSAGISRNNWITLGNLSAAMKFQPYSRLAFGAGIARITDSSFDGMYHVREDFPGPYYGDILKTMELTVKGGLYESAAGFSWRPVTWMNIGISGGFRFGQVSYDSTYMDRKHPENDTLICWDWDESSFCWHAGLIFPLGLTRLGVSWASPSEHYYGRIAAGAIMYTGEMKQGAFGAEIEIIDPGDINELKTRILGQFHPEGSLTFRGAFTFSNRGDEIERQGIGIALGAGIAFGKLTLNAAFSWSSDNIDAIAFGYAEPEVIKLSSSILSAGLNWNL
ncbi:MAG: hypothetical protein K8R76_01850 [Candidatus Aegiribacteria sp.]|nr:hypothetical protein [Candidatus Aegiribacteria sp.]